MDGLDALREQIRQLEGGARVHRRRQASGVAVVDALVGGLPRPGILEITGPRGSGVTSLALHLVAAATRHEPVAWVDTGRSLYPPAAATLGVALSRLLVVRPPATGQHAELWATEQLLRSGCFGLVVVDRPAGGVLRSTGHGWGRACEHGHSVAVVLGERPARWLPAEVRLAVGGGQVTVIRDRGGRVGASRPLPQHRSGTLPYDRREGFPGHGQADPWS